MTKLNLVDIPKIGSLFCRTQMTQITADEKLMIEESLDQYFDQSIKTYPRYGLSLLPNDKAPSFKTSLVSQLNDQEHILFWKTLLRLLDFPIFDYKKDGRSKSEVSVYPNGIPITDPHWTLTDDREQLRLWVNQHGYVERNHIDSCGSFYICSLYFHHYHPIPASTRLNNFLDILKDFGFEEQKCSTHTEFRKPKQVN